MLPANVLATHHLSLVTHARAAAGSTDAEDLVQEVYVRALQSWSKLRDRKPAKLFDWLRSTLRDVVEERGIDRGRQPDPDELQMAGIL